MAGLQDPYYPNRHTQPQPACPLGCVRVLMSLCVCGRDKQPIVSTRALLHFTKLHLKSLAVSESGLESECE